MEAAVNVSAAGASADAGKCVPAGVDALPFLTQAESDDDKTIDIAGPSESEADILTRVMLEDLIEYLGTFEGKRYDTIFQMLYDQCGTQEIADELGVAWSTAKDAVKKVRQLAQEHTGLTRN